jgi:hypothetical protein
MGYVGRDDVSFACTDHVGCGAKDHFDVAFEDDANLFVRMVMLRYVNPGGDFQVHDHHVRQMHDLALHVWRDVEGVRRYGVPVKE